MFASQPVVYFDIMDTDIQVQPQPIDIKNLILNIRGTQVLLDSDVAMLYGYETKNINLAASRNKNRFPESFRFQLTKEEVEAVANMRLQSATASRLEPMRLQIEAASKRNVRYRPYAFTEQGIAMLSGILRNEVAVQVSIGIMNAFVEMRKFIAAYGSAFERLASVEYRLLEHDKKFDEVFNLIQLPGIPKQGVYHQGQIYDAFKLAEDIIKSAAVSITIIDSYADDSVLDMLAKKASGVAVTIITANPNKITRQNIDKFNQQYPSVKVIGHKGFHDRFIIIDDSVVRWVGASLKDLGKKFFGIATLEDEAPKKAVLQEVQTITQAAQTQQP